MVTEADLTLPDGRRLHVYDTHPDDRGERLAVFWHHGTPNIGAPPTPLFAAAERLGLRWVSHDRPAYGGSTPQPERQVASVAADVTHIADALDIEHFAAMGHSGGGAHALACGARLPERVLAVVSISGLAPHGAPDLDYFAGFWPTGAAELRAAVQGRETLAACLASGTFDPETFTAADHAALNGPWAWLNEVVGPAQAAGPEGMIEDDLASVRPWGFDPAGVRAPLLLLHGGQDRMVPCAHGEWLARHCATATLRLSPEDGHLSILSGAEAALEWLAEQAK